MYSLNESSSEMQISLWEILNGTILELPFLDVNQNIFSFQVVPLNY